MSLCQKQRCLSQRFRLVQLSFLQPEGLPFAEVLPEEQIEEAFAAEDAAFAQDEVAWQTGLCSAFAPGAESGLHEEQATTGGQLVDHVDATGQAGLDGRSHLRTVLRDI